MSDEIRPIKEEPSKGWRKLTNRCFHPEHNPPGMIVIPSGHELVHTCPACGHVTTITNHRGFEL